MASELNVAMSVIERRDDDAVGKASDTDTVQDGSTELNDTFSRRNSEVLCSGFRQL